MKDTFKLFGIVALLAIIGLSLVMCNDGNGSAETKFEGTWRNPYGSNVTFVFTGNLYTQSNNNGAINSGTFTFTETTITFVSKDDGTWTQGYTLSGTTLTLQQIPGRNYGPYVKHGTGTASNTDPKSIKITGIPGSGGIGVWIFAELPHGNELPTVTAMAAGPISNGTLFVDLMVPENNTLLNDNCLPWTGNGNYYVALVPIGSGDTWLFGNAMFFMDGGNSPVKVSFNQQLTTVNYSGITSGGSNPNAKTIKITDVPSGWSGMIGVYIFSEFKWSGLPDFVAGKFYDFSGGIINADLSPFTGSGNYYITIQTTESSRDGYAFFGSGSLPEKVNINKALTTLSFNDFKKYNIWR